MMRVSSPLKALTFATLVAVPASFGYIRSVFSFSDGTVVAVKRSDAAAIQFYVNNKIAPNLQSSASGSAVTVFSAGSDPVAAIQSALATWNAVSTSTVKFMPLKTTDKVANPGDKQMTVVVGSSADDLSALGFTSVASPGALAVTLNAATPFLVGSVATGDVSDSDIIINPAFAFSTDSSPSTTDLQAVMTHELGHALGANHNGLLGATMFQFSAPTQRFLSQDDIYFAAAVYPAAGSRMGTLSGKVVASDGSPVQSGLVTLVDTAGGASIAGLTAQDGSYSIVVKPASYLIFVEPITATSIVQPGNLYLSAATAITSNFQATVLGGVATPTLVAVPAGGTAAAPNLTVTPGTSSLQLPYVAIGGAGASADITNVRFGLPVPVNSGQAVDIVLVGGGMDDTIAVRAIGPGISVRPGSVRVDDKVKFGGSLTGQPVVRFTVDVTGRQDLSLASLFITKGASSFAMSGAFPLVPARPRFTAKSIVSAASYKSAATGNAVSPGGIYSIYDTDTNSLGPTAFAQPDGYDGYGKLPTSLGGVTVTFDGVLAPLYLSYAGQLNLQVPYEVAGKDVTKVVVNFNGSVSDVVTVPVVPTHPAFFTSTALGTDVITQNFPDYSLNASANPVARGGTVLLYGTGIGKLSYDLGTGVPGIAPPASYASTWTCSFGGKQSNAFAYWNYGFVGEALWVSGVPADAPTGAVTVTCTDTVTGATTQQGTFFIK